MIRRRSFLIGCSSIVAAPVFAQLALPPSARHQPQETAAVLPSSTAQERIANPESIALRIDGWEATSVAGTDVWVQINSSWRATWR
jgi:hypothetical protein